jgi:ABC-2 type transport system permease protein
VKFLHDTWLVFQRHMLLMLRTPIWIFLGITQPIVYLILFAPMLKPALASLGTASMADAYRIYVPGMLVALALGGGLYVGFGLLAELRSGIIERARVTPVSRVSLLLGRSLRDVVSLLVQGAIITVLSIPFGLFVRIQDLLLAFLLLALITLLTSAVSYGIAMKVGNEGALGQVINNVAQPLMLLSGCLLPIALAPGWLQAIAAWNPLGWAVDGMRALFVGKVGDAAVWQSTVMIAVLTLLALVWSARLFTRTVR